MKNNNLKPIIALGATMAMLLGTVLPVYAADVTGSMKTDVSTNSIQQKLGVSISANLRTEAENKIDARIKALNELLVRINSMEKINAAGKANLAATINASISEMTELRTKIAQDSDAAIFKTDVQSITKSYRIYLLVMPQTRIIAASDRVVTTAGLMSDLGAKLKTRISTEQQAGKDVSNLNVNLTDFNAKIADANVQAQAAINIVANLAPDNGDRSIFNTNQQALKDSREKIRMATADLHTARQDAENIIKTLKSLEVSAGASAKTE